MTLDNDKVEVQQSNAHNNSMISQADDETREVTNQALRNDTVVIAAYNEADMIADTIRSLKAGNPGLTILVVDDGSIDNTAQVAKECGAKVLRLTQNRGKGGALNYCVEKMELSSGPGAVLFLDADLGQSAQRALILIDAVQQSECDMAIAKFPRPKIKGGFGLVKGLARRGIHKHTGKYFDEPLSGQRAMTREVLSRVLPFASGFGIEVKMTIDAMKAGYRVEEFEVSLSHRFSTRSIKGFYHRGRQFVAVAKVLLGAGR